MSSRWCCQIFIERLPGARFQSGFVASAEFLCPCPRRSVSAPAIIAHFTQRVEIKFFPGAFSQDFSILDP